MLLLPFGSPLPVNELPCWLGSIYSVNPVSAPVSIHLHVVYFENIVAEGASEPCSAVVYAAISMSLT